MTDSGDDMSSVPQTPDQPPVPAQSAPPEPPVPPIFAPPQPPPSQTAFVLAVARDVYADLVPEALRPVVKSVAATLLTLLLVRVVFGRKRR